MAACPLGAAAFAGVIRGRTYAAWASSCASFVFGAGALVLYTFTTYMQKFLVNTAGMDIKVVSSVMTSALVVFMLLKPALGALSDRIGRRRNLLFGGLMTVLAVPLLAALSRATDGFAAFLLLSCSLFILTFYSSVSGLFKSELFPAHVRTLGVCGAHNIATAIFGGTAEFAALFAKQRGHETWFYGTYPRCALLCS